MKIILCQTLYVRQYFVYTGYISTDRLKCQPWCLSVAFPPHKLIQVWRELMAFHTFELCFDPWPIALEVQGVIDCSVSWHIWQTGHVVISCPFITVYLSWWFGMLLDDWEECCSVPLVDYLHVSQCRGVADIHHAKDPHWIGWSMSTMMLKGEQA